MCAVPFARLRDQGLTELLETVYLMTGPQYLSSIQEVLVTASSWQQVEGALFCLRAIAGRVRRHAGAASPNGCNGQADRAQQEQQLLLGLFETVCSPGSRVASSLNNPYVCATAAGLVGAYAAWFDNTVNSPLEGALQLLLHALSFRDSWRAAAAAFRALTMRCATRLAAVPVLQSLAAAVTAAIAPTPQPGQVRGWGVGVNNDSFRERVYMLLVELCFAMISGRCLGALCLHPRIVPAPTASRDDSITVPAAPDSAQCCCACVPAAGPQPGAAAT